MVIAVFPIAKLGFLLLKQLSKPLANIIKNSAKSHPFFRKYVCIPPAQAYHWCDMQVQLHVKGRWKPVKVVPITEEEAVDLGANLIGEVVLFSLLSGLLIAELSRQGDKKAEKEKIKDEEILNLIESVIHLVHEVDELKAALKKVQSQENHDDEHEDEHQHSISLDHLQELKEQLLEELTIPITRWENPLPLDEGDSPTAPH